MKSRSVRSLINTIYEEKISLCKYVLWLKNSVRRPFILLIRADPESAWGWAFALFGKEQIADFFGIKREEKQKIDPLFCSFGKEQKRNLLLSALLVKSERANCSCCSFGKEQKSESKISFQKSDRENRPFALFKEVGTFQSHEILLIYGAEAAFLKANHSLF